MIMSDLKLQPLESHLTKITQLIELLEENNQSIDNVAYIINREQGNELAIELDSNYMLKDALGNNQDEYKSKRFIDAGLGWKLIKGATYLGMRIIVE